jgi:hypothetical protein
VEADGLLRRPQLHIITGGDGEEQTQYTTRHKLPKSLDAYNDRVYMCHPWDGLQTALPPMSEATEKDLISNLLLNLGEKLQVETGPGACTRERLPRLPANSVRAGQGGPP